LRRAAIDSPELAKHYLQLPELAVRLALIRLNSGLMSVRLGDLTMVDRGDGGETTDENSVLVRLPNWQAEPVEKLVTFKRHELNIIFRIYGQMVAAGEWRDYAIDHLRDRAVFSIFRRTSEVPMFRVVKDPRLARRQGAYSIVSASGQILKRGHDLAVLLRYFDKRLKLVIS
jgi:hypothetical protein